MFYRFNHDRQTSSIVIRAETDPGGPAGPATCFKMLNKIPAFYVNSFNVGRQVAPAGIFPFYLFIFNKIYRIVIF